MGKVGLCSQKIKVFSRVRGFRGKGISISEKAPSKWGKKTPTLEPLHPKVSIV